MKKLFKMMKPGDLVLLLFLVVLSFLPVIIFSYSQADNDHTHNTVVISSDGEVVHEIELLDDGETEVFEFEDDQGHTNKIIREGSIVYMVEANCPDQLCVRQGEISKVGETIVCLPHSFLVEIQSENPDTDEQPDIDAIT